MALRLCLVRKETFLMDNGFLKYNSNFVFFCFDFSREKLEN